MIDIQRIALALLSHGSCKQEWSKSERKKLNMEEKSIQNHWIILKHTF